jgi:uncharacterized protein (TIGR02598 family)
MKTSGGFSLTETVIALGLFAFCILPIIGLIHVGMGAARSVEQEAQAVNLAEAFFGAWQVRPTNATGFEIPGMFTNPVVPLDSTKPGTMYFDGAGAQVNSNSAAAMKLEYDINTPKAEPAIVNIKLDFSWPVSTNATVVQKRFFKRAFPR